MLVPWLDEYIEYPDQFPRPDWKSIAQQIEQQVDKRQWNEAWQEVSLKWLQKIADVLGKDYDIYESENFLVLTDETQEYADVFLTFLEQSLRSLFYHLPGIARNKDYGKHLVTIFDSLDHYYSYIAYFYPEVGEFALSGGIFVNNSYGHFVFPHQELPDAEIVAAHELTHACLSHLPIPLWLNEGIAGTMEDIITGVSPLRFSHELLERHRLFWGEEEIQQFWSGISFQRPDEGNELSYHLARLAVKALSHDYETFCQFVLTAHFRDGGEAAAEECFGGSLGGVIAQFFGEGDWAPAPGKWTDRKNSPHSENA